MDEFSEKVKPDDLIPKIDTDSTVGLNLSDENKKKLNDLKIGDCNIPVVFVINPDNPKQSLSIHIKDKVDGFKYADYLADERIPKALFERQ